MEKSERRKKLDSTLKDFNKKHKSEIFTMGNEIQTLEVIPTSVKEFDDFIGGGFKQGGHTIIWGQYSVGKTALILTAIANAQKLDKLVCYVNTEKPLDPERFRFFGIDLDNLVYIEAPESAEDALEAMRTLCKDKVIDLFIIDSLNGLCPKSSTEGKEGAERSLEKKDVAALALTLSNFYNKVNAHVFRAKSAVVWIGQARTQGIGSYFVRQGLSGGKAQEFYAYQIIEMRRDEKSNNPTKDAVHYFLDPDGKMHKETKKIECGFGIVCKLNKTNSSKSSKDFEDGNHPLLLV
ncbi:MAG: ATPase domain-containing protein, partial [Nanoarchaeota archaeon]